jgi:hypothetical protein
LIFPDGAHVPPDGQQIVRREAGQLFLDGRLVGVDLDLGEANPVSRKHLVGVYED